MIWGLPAESPKRVSCTVQTVLRTGGKCPKRGFAPCKRLLGESHFGDPKTPFAPSLKHFWAFWLFRQLYQGRGIANPGTLWGWGWFPHRQELGQHTLSEEPWKLSIAPDGLTWAGDRLPEAGGKE